MKPAPKHVGEINTPEHKGEMRPETVHNDSGYWNNREYNMFEDVLEIFVMLWIGILP